MNARKRPFKQKNQKDTYRWNGLIIKKQDNKLWSVWFNYRDELASDIKTLKECMDVIDLHYKRKSKTHLRLVK